MLACPSSVLRKSSSSGVVMNPSSIGQLGMDVSRSTRNPAWCTPLSLRPTFEHTLRWMKRASSMLRSMFALWINSNMM